MKKKQLLIVDDAMIMRARIKSIATAAGWEVCGEGTNGQDAIDMYQSLSPSLMTLDIVMPGKDGVEALRELVQVVPKAQVVMITAINQRKKLDECIQLGAIDFIVKPFDPEQLHSFFVKYEAKSESAHG